MAKKAELIKNDLLEAVFLVTQPSFTNDQKNEIVAIMAENGHVMVWNAVR